MKRQIKFRIWDKQEGKFFKPTYEAYKGNLEDLIIGLSGDLLKHTLTGIEHESMFPDRYLIQQYTGCNDIEDKEIYEGDIVENRDGDLRKVLYFMNSFEMRLMNGNKDSNNTIWYYQVKVVGNIYQNPELIK